MGKYMYSIVAAVIVWGATAGHYINTGMSIAMIVFALFAGSTIYKKTYPRDFHVDKNIFVALLSVYTLLLLTTLFHLDNIKNLYGGEYNWTAFVLYTMPFWMILYVGWDRDISRSIIATFSTIVLAMCVYGIYEHYAKHIDRISSFYTSPTYVGLLLDLFIPFTVATTWFYKRNKVLLGGMTCLLFLEVWTLVLTKTRGSFLALSAAALAVLFVALVRYSDKISCIKKCILIFVTGLFIVAGGLFSYHIGSGSMYRMMGEERPIMWQGSYQMWQDHKLVGIGLSEWEAAWFGKYRPAEATETGNVMPHNMPLYFLSTSGIVGTIGYVLFNVFMLIYFWKNLGIHGNNPFAWGMFAIFIAYTIHGMVDATFISKPVSRVFYMLFGASILFEKWGKVKY